MSPSHLPQGLVVAAGLSPAWQAIMRFPKVVPGEVNRAATVWRCASGKVLNVAAAVAHLGHPVRAVTILGGTPAAAMTTEMQQLGVEMIVVPTRGETRTCTTLLDDARGETTELVENAGAVESTELSAFATALTEAAADAAVAVLSGSLPAGTPDTLYRDLLARLTCPVVLDARGPEMLKALQQRPLLVKPNREELAATFGQPLDDQAAVLQACDALRARGAQWVLITAGSQPAVVVGPAGRFRLLPPPVVDLVNPIGCGDCLAAGFAAGIASGQAPLAALRQGLAAAADNVRRHLAGRLDAAEVQRQAAGVVVERL